MKKIRIKLPWRASILFLCCLAVHHHVRGEAVSIGSINDYSNPLTSPFWVKIMEEYGTKSYNYIPATRRAASADIYNYRKNEEILKSEHPQIVDANNNTTKPADTSSAVTEEYMIISGGYTDKDWKSFPVYAFPISSAIRTTSGQWIDLSPSPDLDEPTCKGDDSLSSIDILYQEASFTNATGDDDDKDDPTQDPWENAQSCSPYGRMGHASVVYNNHLYVFGGLIYDEEQGPMGNGNKESFRLEDIPYVYRLNLKKILYSRTVNYGDDVSAPSNEPSTGWKRIIPRVKPSASISSPAADVLMNFVNRGEMQGGLWPSASSGKNDKFVMYGGLRITRVEYDNSPSNFVKGTSVVGAGPSSQTQNNQFHSRKIVELPLGDVWAYDLKQDAWEKMTNDYGKGVWDDDADMSNKQMNRTNEEFLAEADDDWMKDDLSLFPRARTAHAAALVGNELIIHGGMGWDEKINDWDTSTDWETFGDMVGQTQGSVFFF